MSKFWAIRTENGGFELIVVGGEGEGFDDCRVRAVHTEHVQGEILSVAEEMKSEGTGVVFRKSSEVRMTMRVELSNIADCDEGFELSLTDDGVGVDMAEDGGFIYQDVTSSFEKGRKIE